MSPDSSLSDSSDDENIAYLIATGAFPGVSYQEQIGSLRSQGRRPNIQRDFDAAVERLKQDYLDPDCKYSSRQFERRFRMPRRVFDRLLGAISGKGIFVRRTDITSKKGLHPLQRIVAALRMLAYGTAADACDEYLQISEDSAFLSLREFCKKVIHNFGDTYLREPTESDLARIMEINAARGFPGCIGSMDCQHWEWKNSPIAWAGQFKGKEKKPTIVLEAIADSELWIWHAFFGSPGTLNDINILDRSTTVEKMIVGLFPPSIQYKVNERIRTMPYYLTDGIYPDWAIFVKTIAEGSTQKEKAFAAAQEAMRKDVERAFGVLVARFHILQRPARFWYRSDIANVIKACIILHNMIVEHRRETYKSAMSSLSFFEEARGMFADGVEFIWHSKSSTQERLQVTALPGGMWARMVSEREQRIMSRIDHFSLKHDLVEHNWRRQGYLQSF